MTNKEFTHTASWTDPNVLPQEKDAATLSSEF
jgi:hypothetical protein